MFLIVYIVVFVQILGFSAAARCAETFRFASYYGSTMVLQRAPARATVWGYAFTTGDSVTLTLTNDNTGESLDYTTTSVEGSAGLPIWSVSMDPVSEVGPYTITVSSVDCVLSLTDVLFGDVWFCSGQSNMAHWMFAIDDPEPDINKSTNYPDIRTFQVAREINDSAQEDLISIRSQWAISTPDNIGSFSAVCWLFGTHLYDKYQIPVGLIESAWGGTRIEAWSSPAALDVCFPNGADPGLDKNGASVLYNTMVHPFFPMPIYGSIWYQGESNHDNPIHYGCAIREMVNDWRASWFEATNTMDSQFPFGQVQLAPFRDEDTRKRFANIRWHQTFEYGYVPNDQLQRFFMAVATDLPDFDSPLGSLHPRYKRQIAQRLALGAFMVAYEDNTNGTHQGPLPASFSLGDYNDVIITMQNTEKELVQRGNSTTQTGYEICCSEDHTVFCDNNNTRWEEADINFVSTGQVNINMPCRVGEFAVGVRYTWRTTPCHILEECPIYSAPSENSLPAPPFIFTGLIE